MAKSYQIGLSALSTYMNIVPWVQEHGDVGPGMGWWRMYAVCHASANAPCKAYVNIRALM